MSHVMRKPYANNKDTDQPAHPRSLVSVLLVLYLDSIIPVVAMYEIASVLVFSVAEQASLSLPW